MPVCFFFMIDKHLVKGDLHKIGRTCSYRSIFCLLRVEKVDKTKIKEFFFPETFHIHLEVHNCAYKTVMTMNSKDGRHTFVDLHDLHSFEFQSFLNYGRL